VTRPAPAQCFSLETVVSASLSALLAVEIGLDDEASFDRVSFPLHIHLILGRVLEVPIVPEVPMNGSSSRRLEAGRTNVSPSRLPAVGGVGAETTAPAPEAFSPGRSATSGGGGSGEHCAAFFSIACGKDTATTADAIATQDRLNVRDESTNRTAHVITVEADGFANSQASSQTPTPAVVPEPATLLLFGTTMAGLELARWRRRRQQ
jgi:hypothetical protein